MTQGYIIQFYHPIEADLPEEAKDLFTKTLIISTLLIILLGVIGSFIS